MNSLKALIPYLKKYKKKLSVGFIFIILSNSSDAFYPLVIGAAIDDLTKGTFSITAHLCSCWSRHCDSKGIFSFYDKADADHDFP